MLWQWHTEAFIIITKSIIISYRFWWIFASVLLCSIYWKVTVLGMDNMRPWRSTLFPKLSIWHFPSYLISCRRQTEDFSWNKLVCFSFFIFFHDHSLLQTETLKPRPSFSCWCCATLSCLRRRKKVGKASSPAQHIELERACHFTNGKAQGVWLCGMT